MLGNPAEITAKPIQKIINDQVDIKVGRLQMKNLMRYWKKKRRKTEKLLVSIKYTEKFRRDENLTTYFSDYGTQSINKILLRNGWNAPSFSSPSKGDHEITKNNRCVTLTWIAKVQANNIATKLLFVDKAIWFHRRYKDGADMINKCSSQRNSYRYHVALQKHESSGLLLWWWHRLL